MGPCESKKLNKNNQTENKSKYDQDKNIHDYNTNNTKNIQINIDYTSNDIDQSQIDLKFKSTMTQNDNIGDTKIMDESISKRNTTEIDTKKQKYPFLPHIYNSLSYEDTKFYKTLIQIQHDNIIFPKSIYSLDDLKIQITVLAKNSELDDYNKLLTCWKIFNWIISNIECVEFSKQSEREDIEFSIDSIFINRSTTAYGIARLFKYLISLIEIKSEIIPGYLKTKHSENKFNHINHFWNTVELFNQPRIIDCSCAGDIGISSNNKFPQFYFCSIPQHIIYTHFPKNLEHSCLKNVKMLMDLNSFHSLPIFNKYFFMCGFQLCEYKNAQVDFEELITRNHNDNLHLNEVRFEFCLPDKIIPQFELKKDSHMLKQNTRQDLNRLVIMKRRKFCKDEDRKKINTIDYYFLYESFLFKTFEYDNVFKILDDFVIYELIVRLNEKGNYKLCLSAKIENNYVEEDIKTEEILSEYEECFNYKILADFHDFKQYSYDELKYPITTESYLMKNCEIMEPVFYHLQSYFVNKKNINFTVRIPEAIDAAIFYDTQDEFEIMNKKDNYVFTYVHNIERKFEKINIAANFGESEYVILITYEF